MALRLGLLALFIALLPQAMLAQEGDAYRIETQIDAPHGPDSRAVEDLSRRANARGNAIYADKISGDLSSGQSQDPLPADSPDRFGVPAIGGNIGVWLVVGLFAAALFIWLRFGGAGNLLNARPKPDMAPSAQQAPEAWAIGPEDLAQGPEALIRRLLALPDRAKAAAGLLRHSLLAASAETRIRLARADTERQAFDRVPTEWRQHNGLKTLLKVAELAHYGGRTVSDETLQQLADIARAILIHGKAAPGPHA